MIPMLRVSPFVLLFLGLNCSLRADLVALRFCAFNAEFGAYIARYDDGPPLWVQFTQDSNARALELFSKIGRSWLFADRLVVFPPRFHTTVRIDLLVEADMQELRRIGHSFFPTKVEVKLRDWSIAEPFQFIVFDHDGENSGVAILHVENVEAVFGSLFAPEERRRFVHEDPEARGVAKQAAGRTAEGLHVLSAPLDAELLGDLQKALGWPPDATERASQH